MNPVTNRKFLAVLSVAAALLFAVSPLAAQEPRISPHETVSAVVSGDRVTIVYGRPYTKDPKTGEPRIIWGKLVPYGEVWRTGADEATLLLTQKPISFGAKTIPAGAYTLWTMPAADGSAKLILSKQIGQWGTGPGSYDPQQDLARIDLKKEPLPTAIDQLTIAIGESPGGGVIKMSWEKTAYSAPFTVSK